MVLLAVISFLSLVVFITLLLDIRRMDDEEGRRG